MKVIKNEKHRCYTPILDEYLDPVNQINGDYKEGYYIGVEVPEDDPRAQKAFIGPNVWPAACNFWKQVNYYVHMYKITFESFRLEVDTLPGWRETMEIYHQEALAVARAVPRLISLALDLRSNFFDQPVILGDPTGILRLLHYEGHVSDCIMGIYGAGAYTDFGFITLLTTDNVLALQICKDKNTEPKVWEYVAPLTGMQVIVLSAILFVYHWLNIGDMLERWSNNIFRSTLHCVLRTSQDRYSASTLKSS